MLSKIQFTLALFILATGMRAQNLQLHFDPRHSLYGDNVAAPVNYLTATFEMFKPDQWGSTFAFVDFDFNFNKGPGLAYAEIARAVKLGDFPLLAQIEYNGGLGLVRDSGVGFSIPNAYLGGVAYPFRLGSFFMNTYLVYKLNAFQEASHDAQWTFTWNASFANNKLSLAGFFDLWSENKDRTGVESGKRLVLLSEPQIWYNITPNLSIGSEIEVSYNFVLGANSFYVIPTLATKWNF